MRRLPKEPKKTPSKCGGKGGDHEPSAVLGHNSLRPTQDGRAVVCTKLGIEQCPELSVALRFVLSRWKRVGSSFRSLWSHLYLDQFGRNLANKQRTELCLAICRFISGWNQNGGRGFQHLYVSNRGLHLVQLWSGLDASIYAALRRIVCHRFIGGRN